MRRFPHMDGGSKEGQDHFDKNNEISFKNVHLLCNLKACEREEGVLENIFVLKTSEANLLNTIQMVYA